MDDSGQPAAGRRIGSEILLVGLATVVIRIAFKALGMQFDASTVDLYWQFLETDQLTRNLGQSLHYLHMQPPGLNALAAVSLKLFGAASPRAQELLFGALGVAMNIAFFRLVKLLTGNRLLSWAVVLLVAANPVFIIYENQFFSTHLVVTLMVLALACLERTVATGQVRWLACYGLTLLAITLFRSMYHPLWWLTAFLPAVFSVKLDRRSVATAALLLLAVIAWPLKNQVVFGRFTSSTWLGMNLYNTVYTRSYTTEEMRQHYSGARRPFRRPPGARSAIGAIPPFSDPEHYAPYITPAVTGIRVLDAPYRWGKAKNLNSSVYLAASDLYLQDYLAIVRADPAILLRVFASSSKMFFRPGSDNEVLALNQASRGNLRDFRTLLAAFDVGLYWRPPALAGTGGAAGASPMLVLGYLLVLAWCPLQALRTFRNDRRRAAILGFVWLNAAYVLLVGNIFEYYENMRFRFEIEALMLLACAVAIGDVLTFGPRMLRRLRSTSSR